MSALLLWGTVLVFILKFVTPSVKLRHTSESNESAESKLKGRDEVVRAILGDIRNAKGEKTSIEIAVSPTCPFCHDSLEKIETILAPTGRFDIRKRYTKIHEGDREKIVSEIGEATAEEDRKWCEEHGIKGTPTVFVNGKELDNSYDLGDLLYL